MWNLWSSIRLISMPFFAVSFTCSFWSWIPDSPTFGHERGALYIQKHVNNIIMNIGKAHTNWKFYCVRRDDIVIWITHMYVIHTHQSIQLSVLWTKLRWTSSREAEELWSIGLHWHWINIMVRYGTLT
jgi:hypothetical protein